MRLGFTRKRRKQKRKAYRKADYKEFKNKSCPLTLDIHLDQSSKGNIPQAKNSRV